jgi:hypothetical protein
MSKYSFEKDVEISKSELAKIQLEDAIDLFLSGKRISVITLAGAAKEVFARLSNLKGQQSAIEESFSSIQQLREETSHSIMGDKSENEIFNDWNKSKNILKHHNKKDGVSISFSRFDESYMMLQRAIHNSAKLGMSIKNRQEYENWLIENIYM